MGGMGARHLFWGTCSGILNVRPSVWCALEAMIRQGTMHLAGRCAILPSKMPDASDLQQERFRRMTPAEKLRAAERLYWSARALKRAMLRSLYPQASDQELDRMVRNAFLHAHI